jgi:23S rRNA (uridine2552-2'-O)-methyltransferase
LGTAAGGWFQYMAKIVGDEGQVIGCDILPMDFIAVVAFLVFG